MAWKWDLIRTALTYDSTLHLGNLVISVENESTQYSRRCFREHSEDSATLSYFTFFTLEKNHAVAASLFSLSRL
jgi:hypothetical protein